MDSVVLCPLLFSLAEATEATVAAAAEVGVVATVEADRQTEEEKAVEAPAVAPAVKGVFGDANKANISNDSHPTIVSFSVTEDSFPSKRPSSRSLLILIFKHNSSISCSH